MLIDYVNLIDWVNHFWSWKNIEAKSVVMVNSFGNILISTSQDYYYRICPEELSFQLVARSCKEFNCLRDSNEFILDWKMERLTSKAKSDLGELNYNQVYSFIMPPVLGGNYSTENMFRVDLKENISLCSEMAFQIEGLPDGSKIELITK